MRVEISSNPGVRAPTDTLRLQRPPAYTPIHLPALILAVLFTGCGPGGNSAPDAPPLSTTRDSAGVTVVENRLPQPGELPYWKVAEEPTLSIGAVDGDTGLDFIRVDEASRLSDGRIVVVDGRAQDVRMFGPDGSFMGWVGGRGEGPGDFQMVGMVGVLPGDTLLLVDHSLRRVSRFTSEGQFLRSFQVRWRERLSPLTIGVFRNGTLVAKDNPRDNPADEFDNVLQRLPIHYRGIDADGEVTLDFGVHPGAEQAVGSELRSDGVTFTYQRAIPFGKVPSLAASWDRLFLGTADGWEFMAYDRDGKLTHLVRLDRDPRPVTEDLKARLLEDALAQFDPDQAPALRSYYRDAHYPVHMPAYRSFKVDPLGYLWVEEYRPTWEGPPAWMIFDPDGVLSAEANFPPGLRVTEVGVDHILGVSQDDLGVEYVQLFRLERGAGKPTS